MKTTLQILALGLSLTASTLSTQAQAPAAAPAPATPSQEALEAEFIKALSPATFVGRWTGIKEGALTPERDEKYQIESVAKTEGDNWVINAKMKYGNQEVVLPIPVKVKWAGDTAVIVVDNLTIPGGGTYNARVLVYKGTYAGTWTGGQRGGLLSGMIESGASGAK
jgi:hypothetical protein